VVWPLAESLLARERASLTSLSLAENKQLGKDGGTALGQMLRSYQVLRSLNLRGCGINGAAGCEIARGLSVNSTLTALDLSSNGLGIKGGKSIADALRLNKTLTFVSLHTNNLSDKLEDHLRQITTIKKLIITVTQLGDERHPDNINFVKSIEVKATDVSKESQGKEVVAAPLRTSGHHFTAPLPQEQKEPIKEPASVQSNGQEKVEEGKTNGNNHNHMDAIPPGRMRNGNHEVRPEEAMAAQVLEELLDSDINDDKLQKKRKMQ